MYGFTIHIDLKLNAVSNFLLKNQKNITFENFSFNYFGFKKFENDKVFSENKEYIIGIDGVVLNLVQLKNAYGISDYFNLIISLYSKHNIQFVSELKGEFSGFIFDKKTKQLLFFNNKTATKQVFYSSFEKSIIISPTIENIINLKERNNLKSTLNVTAVYTLLSFGAMIENDTLVNGIFKLNAGEYLEIEHSYKLKNYHTFNNIAYTINNKKQAIDGLNELFLNALTLEYQKDIEYNYQHLATLSGGLDSRMTVMIADALGFKNDTFCFSQTGYLDETIANEIAKKLALNHTFIPLNGGDYLMNLTRMIQVTNSLQAFTAAAHYDFSVKKLNLANYGLMHTGQIGDAILGGYISKNSEYLSKKESTKFLNKTNTKSAVLKYKNEEVFKLYQRAFNLINVGSYITESHKTYLTSPFLDDEIIEFSLAIDPKLKVNQNIYLEWITKYHPEIAKYKWERTGFKPNKIWKTSLSRYTKKLIKEFYKLTNQSEKFTMTPTDFWFKNNSKLRAFYSDYFKNNSYLIAKNRELTKDFNFLFNEGNNTEKSVVLTVLETIKKYKLEV